MISPRLALAAALGASLLGCSSRGTAKLSFPFLRPENLEFACLAPHTTGDTSAFAVLPRACCEVYDTTSSAPRPQLPASCTQEGTDRLGTPVLHALITQSTRGEVAAVDLGANKVLDSDRLVPGYTFLDSGGLPSALVVPRRQPRSTQERGPAWTFVASAEEYQVRAIPTCRFRSGQACGPDLAERNADETAYVARTRVALPSAPQDMLLGPDEALWVTLPDLGLLARIELAETPEGDIVDAFALDPASNAPKLPQFFRVARPGALAPLAPIDEAEAYLATCGLGFSFQADTLKLPLAPRATATAEPRPSRMRFDAESGLLLVTDPANPALHAFALGTDGGLRALGALATGAPIRDFALTPHVPVQAQLGSAKASDTMLPAAASPEDPSAPSKRYLYAIDDRDGTLMVFQLGASSATAQLPVLQPLRAPEPGTLYADRIDAPSELTALDVIDTRARSSYVCGEPNPPGLSAEQQKARTDLSSSVQNDRLRGVFVALTSMSGVLSVVDVHDLDLWCRAKRECGPATGGDLTLARSADSAQGVAVRRHALRRDRAARATGTIGDSAHLSTITCPPPVDAWAPSAESYVAVSGLGSLVCTPADPWRGLNESWAIRYRGVIPGTGLQGGYLDASDPARLVLRAPMGTDLCERGILPGDFAYVVGAAPSWVEGNCPTPASGAEPKLVIDEAYGDHLVVHPVDVNNRELPEADRASERDELLRCYPDSVGFEVHASGYLVTGTTLGTYLHNVVADAAGRCVVDPALDPRITSRPFTVPESAQPSDPAQRRTDGWFVNPYLAFRLKDAGSTADSATRDTTLQIRDSSTRLSITNVDSANRVLDALPVAVRYNAEIDRLFVLDTASQGLRRYTLQPLEDDASNFR